MEQHQEKVREIHLHDALVPPTRRKGRASDHLALGQGGIDVAALLQRLEETEYEGPVILEVNSQADLEQSLEYLGSHLREPAALRSR